MTEILMTSTLWISVLLSVSAIFLTYIIRLFKNSNENEARLKNVVKPKTNKDIEQHPSGVKGKKSKLNENTWFAKTEKQIFQHSWLLSTLKGHSDQILDMDYSSNGKYLLSCSEDSRRCEDSSISGCSTPDPHVPKSLTRRQRKNRRKEENPPVETRKKQRPRRGETRRLCPNPLRQFVKLGLSEPVLYEQLRYYVLDIEELLYLGYPVESADYPGRAIIYKTPISVPIFYNTGTRFDVNAQEFVPEERTAAVNYNQVKTEWFSTHKKSSSLSSSLDSSHEFSSSETNISDGSTDGGSDTADTSAGCNTSDGNASKLEDNTSTEDFTASIFVPKNQTFSDDFCLFDYTEGNATEERSCVRCGSTFLIANDAYVRVEACTHHWGKLQRVSPTKNATDKYGSSSLYSCCQREKGSLGCTTSKQHVCSGISFGYNGPFDSYMRTKMRKHMPKDGNFGVYALDCEMCFTVQGLELTKVTVVGIDGRLVYDCLVKPDRNIIDYNTHFSGLSAKDFTKKHEMKTLRQVQNDLMGFINADTILIGHGLENDLRALKLMHGTIIDTAIVFPHYNGLPFKRSLKNLTSSYLKRDIQIPDVGHNSYEDARACAELLLWKLRKDLSC